MKLKWGEEKRKKYKIYTHKLYSAKDVERRMGIKEEKIIKYLESKKTFGRKMGNFWLVRGSEIIKIAGMINKEENKKREEVKSK